MRRLRRSGYVVPVLADSGIAGRKKLEHRRNFEDPQKKQIPTKFEDYWTNPQVRGLLHAMQGRICAYCLTERPLDVEHFRPRSRYWWLAYEVENLVLGCTACNSDRKGNEFPLRAGAIRVTYDMRHMLAAEQRILLDPAEDDVEACFELSDDATCEIRPASHLAPTERKRIQDVIDLFGLNLDFEVRKRRSRVYDEAIRAVHEGRCRDARTMAMRHSEQSIAARFVLKRLVPECPLPNEEEEAMHLARKLWIDLKTKIAELRKLKAGGKTPKNLDKRQMRSCCWALVVLLGEPSATYVDTLQALYANLFERETEESTREEILKAFKAVRTLLSRTTGRT